MKKVAILGAGATFGAASANSVVRPPLLPDLHTILDASFMGINQSADGPILKNTFNKLLELTQTRDDIERFFTLMQVIEEIRSDYSPNDLHLDLSKMKMIYGDSAFSDPLIWPYNLSKNDIKDIKVILEYTVKDPKRQILCCPNNFFKLFVYALREYLYRSILDDFCIYHDKLFKNFGSNDTVATYNYDEISDYTLFLRGKLSVQSFDELGFGSIVFPIKRPIASENVSLLKLHGSFNWHIDGIKNINYNLGSQNAPFPVVILPFYHKDKIYQSNRVYRLHMIKYGHEIKCADEIILVGKNFRNSDEELYKFISNHAQGKKRTLKIIDPKIDDASFIEYHCRLFNAKYEEGWKSLNEFYNSPSSIH
jgi:hypothetical protein